MIMNYRFKCWAECLGNCNGPITNEHLFTKALFKERITIRGIYEMQNGTRPQWLTEKGLEINILNLTANILCKFKTADKAAIEVQKALVSFNDPMRRKGSMILQQPINRTISGVDFAKWLCKTHCNIMAVNNMIPDISYVQYAFGYTPDKYLYFYCSAQVSHALLIRSGHINYTNYVDINNPQTLIFSISLAGLRILVTSFPLHIQKTAKLMNISSLIDRIRCLEQFTPLGVYRIYLDWSNDPCTNVNKN